MIRPNSRSIVDVTTPHKSRTWEGIKRHHTALPTDEVTVEEGIPVTTVPRTILDLAATEGVDVVENLLREMERLELRDRLSLWGLVRRYAGRRGVRRVRTALERLEEEPPGAKASPLEERFAPFLRRHRLPLPRFNDWITVGASATRSTATGREPARSSSSMAGRATRPAPLSVRTEHAIVASESPATQSSTSPGTNSTTNRRRSPPTCGRCLPRKWR
jgi:hypothetical protein